MPVQGFAAIDLETTGLSPRADRVVEIAVVQLDQNLSPCGEFVTLINPGRDIGATHIHGIKARDVADAPRFEQVAPMLLDALRGRVIVAHNAQFDRRFLVAEFTRVGITLPEVAVMCTMQLAPQFLHGLPARSLAACCAAAGIRLDGAHAAAVDARAVAGLLTCYAATNRQLAAEWTQAVAMASRVPWPTLAPAITGLVTREIVARSRAQEAPFLTRLVQQLPRAGTDVGVESYLAVLDEVLEDRRVTAAEAEGLRDLAVSLGISADAVIAAHQMYLQALAVAAWADGVISDAEHTDLREVAGLLGFPARAVDFELAAARGMTSQTTTLVNGRALHVGDTVCITGTTATPREELESRASDAGLRITSAVSRNTQFVVTADPDSESTKARRARELGVPLVAEAVFIALLDRGVPQDPRDSRTRPGQGGTRVSTPRLRIAANTKGRPHTIGEPFTVLYEGDKCKVCAKQIPLSAKARFIGTTTGGRWMVHADCWDAIADQYPGIEPYRAQATEPALARAQQQNKREAEKLRKQIHDAVRAGKMEPDKAQWMLDELDKI